MLEPRLYLLVAVMYLLCGVLSCVRSEWGMCPMFILGGLGMLGLYVSERYTGNSHD